MTTTSCHRTGRFGGFFMHAEMFRISITPWPVKVSSKLAINKRPVGQLRRLGRIRIFFQGGWTQETPGWKNEARYTASLSRSLFSLAEMAAPARPVTRLSITLSSLRAPQSEFRLCEAQVSVFARVVRFRGVLSVLCMFCSPESAFAELLCSNVQHCDVSSSTRKGSTVVLHCCLSTEEANCCLRAACCRVSRKDRSIHRTYSRTLGRCLVGLAWNEFPCLRESMTDETTTQDLFGSSWVDYEIDRIVFGC
jgi:hypothetical protein